MLRTDTIDWVALVTQKAVTFMQTLPYVSLEQLSEYLTSYDTAVTMMSLTDCT